MTGKLQSAYSVVTGPVPDQRFTARTFLEFIRLTNDQWWEHKADHPECSWIFRGHTNSVDWMLLPAAARPINQNILKPLVDKLANYTLGGGNEQLDQAARIYTAYNIALSDFRN